MIDLIGQRLGEYEIVSRLGEGGMAVVYRAQQQNIKREVAVKVIQPSLRQNADFSARFEREAQTIASLSHPNIIKVFDYGILRGFYLRLMDPTADARKNMIYVVMELLTGGDLSDMIRQGALSLPQISQFLTGIASALDYAHQKGVIHCDLKPENILLDEGRNVVLADFGIARLISDTSAKEEDSDFIAGTPYYMAPEQWSGQPTDARTDVYALGIILFEMLTGKAPYDADTPYKLMNKHLLAPVPAVRDVRPELPGALQAVLQRALAKEAAQRYPTAGQLVAEFNAAVAKQSLAASPSSATGGAPRLHHTTTMLRVEKRGYRRLWIGIGGLIAALWIIGLLVLLWPHPNALARGTPNDPPASLNVPALVNTMVAATLTQRAAATTNAALISAYAGTANVQQTVAARILQIDTVKVSATPSHP